jgi:hypothetical protein
MSALAPAVPIPRRRLFLFPRPRLVSAEILKLRKRRGLVITTFAMTVGVTAVVYAILALLHSTNAAKHGPAGGVSNLASSMLVLTMLAGVCATLVGTTAGAGDLSAGVFKELVVTGRSRRALFAARIPGGLAFLLPIVALAYTVAAVASVVFAGSLPAPSAGLLAESGAWFCSPARSGSQSRSASRPSSAPARRRSASSWPSSSRSARSSPRSQCWASVETRSRGPRSAASHRPRCETTLSRVSRRRCPSVRPYSPSHSRSRSPSASARAARQLATRRPRPAESTRRPPLAGGLRQLKGF